MGDKNDKPIEVCNQTNSAGAKGSCRGVRKKQKKTSNNVEQNV